jgi:hypothetical protein
MKRFYKILLSSEFPEVVVLANSEVEAIEIAKKCYMDGIDDSEPVRITKVNHASNEKIFWNITIKRYSEKECSFILQGHDIRKIIDDAVEISKCHPSDIRSVEMILHIADDGVTIGYLNI